ncbi:hypothetical protein ACOMHN_055115 [Nucella lapillus]
MLVMGILIRFMPSLSQDALSGMLKKLVDSASSAGVTLDTSNFGMASILDILTLALIVLGILLWSVALLGLIGTECSLKPVLIAYFIIVEVMFLAQLIVVLIIIINRDAFDGAIKPRLKDVIEKDFTGLAGTDAETLMWNGVMVQLKCCGVDNYNDFATATNWNKTINSVNYSLVTPIACCKTMSNSYTCAISPTDAISNWKTGCYHKLWDFVLKDSCIVPAIAAGLLVFQLVMLILTVIVYNSMSNVRAVRK